MDPKIGLKVGELLEDVSLKVRDVGVTMTAGMLPVDATWGLNCGRVLKVELLSSSALSSEFVVDDGLGNADLLLLFESTEAPVYDSVEFFGRPGICCSAEVELELELCEDFDPDASSFVELDVRDAVGWTSSDGRPE